MSMIIAGVAYHVLPRFTARTVPWPKGIKYHFYLQNIGLLGMLCTKLSSDIWMVGGKNLFLLFSVVTASALFIMVYNLFCILLPSSSNCKNSGESQMRPRKACEEDCSPWSYHWPERLWPRLYKISKVAFHFHFLDKSVCHSFNFKLSKLEIKKLERTLTEELAVKKNSR